MLGFLKALAKDGDFFDKASKDKISLVNRITQIKNEEFDMMDKKVFISHSGYDIDLHDKFKHLLVNGFGINRDSVFSTSSARSLMTGEKFEPDIKTNLQQSKAVFLLISSSYMRSFFCLSELGGAWALNKKIIPIIIEPVTLDLFNKTPIQGTQFRKLTDQGLTEIYDEFCEGQYIKKQNTTDFNKFKNNFLDEIRFLEQRDNEFIGTIIEERSSPIPQNKRCYQLNGLVRNDKQPVHGETHWIFYDYNKHGNLSIGDVIKFSVNDIEELKSWPDGLANARNIYPTNKKIIILNNHLV